MKAIDFVARTDAGNSQRGSIPGQDGVSIIPAGNGQEISLNLRQMDIQGYARDGSNLVINLSDGRVVVLEGYYSATGAPVSRLFISADGYLNEVTLSEGGDGPVYAQYGPTENWAKWSPDEELIFLGGNEVTGPVEDDEVSMLGAAFLGGGGLLGLGGVGAAGAAAAVVAGSGGGDGGGGRGRIEPTVNEDGTITIGGDQDDPKITITGDAEPGSEVDVTIGDQTVTTEADEDGKWEVVFEDETFPEDGEHDVVVVVTEPDGTETTLEGPVVVIDTTPPEVVIEDGVVSTDDIVNADDYEDGIEITGSGEPGAEISVVIEGVTETTVIGEDGQWEVVFDPADIPGGEREVAVVITATDAFGNSTVVTDVVAIDTVPHPIVINASEVGGDGVVNLVEEGAGVAITGSSTPGATVTVTVEGVSRDVLVGEDGTWRAEFDPGTLPGGQYETVVTATTVDAAGNASSTTGTFRVDTEVRDFGMTGAPGGADGVINAAEQGDGFTMSGTVEPGSTVRLTFGTAVVDAAVAADGRWTATFTGAQIAGGTYTGDIVAVATDAAGNVSELRQAVSVDTEANDLSLATDTVGGDGTVNLVETGGQVAITGTATPGATVTVTFAGVTQDVVANASGAWVATVAGSALAAGTYDAPVTAVSVDAAGNRADVSGSVRVDTEVRDFGMTGAPGGADGVINAAEQGDGFTMSGTVEPGSTVRLTFGTAMVDAVVAADGRWTASFTGAQIAGGTYTGDIVAVATDAAGNVSELRQAVSVDTEAGLLTLNAGAIGGDGVINGAEADAGVLVTGTADVGATVIVSLDGVEHTVQADGAGRWQSRYESAEITRGTHVPEVSARTVDAAGNPTEVEATVRVDTQVDNLSLSDLNLAIGADGRDVINNDIATGGFNVTGTIEPGSRVFVTIDGVQHEAQVAANGNWVARFGPNEIAPGERDVALRVDVTDPAGNIAFLTDTVRVDTLVNELSQDGPVTSDNIINISEAAAGVTLTGQVEPGSSAEVRVFGRTYQAVVDAAGNWSVSLPTADIPRQDGQAPMVVFATDGAGNTHQITSSLTLDMVAPETPGIVGYFRQGDGYRNATVETSADDVSIHQVDAGGNVRELALGEQANQFTGETDYFFLNGAGQLAPVSDGSQLVVTSTDAGGNTASTYVVLDETSTSVVNIANPNLSAFDIETIDLRFGDQAQLSLTEEQVLALSGNSDTVLVQGGADDRVTLTGAEAAGRTQIDGQTYDIYTLGNDATVVVDEDIQIVT
ncbi:bacterial Ig-like domain (group 3) [Roseovarius mucosus]|uniref:Bacterial Ig-like domain (Group 3) n=1 Tax=Roseovarius mucosus TaxID=215743 RepID=A0A1V0RKX5_9RHOB|nr:Ig-like domain-containing protein [Roseovarius mucosus]ARE82420.1 bacterial Ig-like domain (group 3) [Roseovarius mucosus]